MNERQTTRSAVSSMGTLSSPEISRSAAYPAIDVLASVSRLTTEVVARTPSASRKFLPSPGCLYDAEDHQHRCPCPWSNPGSTSRSNLIDGFRSYLQQETMERPIGIPHTNS